MWNKGAYIILWWQALFLNLLFSFKEMRLLILDAGVLRTQMLYRNDVFARHAATEKDVNKSYRHAGYRQYILIHHGRLGLGVRRPVPSCCTLAIRDTFPDPDGFYVPYEPSWWKTSSWRFYYVFIHFFYV